MSTQEEVLKFRGVDEVYDKKDFDKQLSDILENQVLVRNAKDQTQIQIYSDLTDENTNKQITTQITKITSSNRMAATSRSTFILNDINPLIDRLRLIKSPEEISYLETAICITGEAIKKVMKNVRSFTNERRIRAVIDSQYALNGSIRVGFPTIIASGPETKIGHDRDFKRELKDTDMIILDIGAEYEYYTADISRSFSKNGKFSKLQRDIYEIVLATQEAVIAMVKPGVTWLELQRKSEELIAGGLKELGLITDEKSPWQFLLWYMQSVGHKLGMDVHDVGGGRYFDATYMPYQENMVITVEPGIYINIDFLNEAKEYLQFYKDFCVNYKLIEFDFTMPSNEELTAFDKAVRKKVEEYNEIGVRIEDDILVTANGYRNLSGYIPKTIEDIEKLMNE